MCKNNRGAAETPDSGRSSSGRREAGRRRTETFAASRDFHKQYLNTPSFADTLNKSRTWHLWLDTDIDTRAHISKPRVLVSLFKSSARVSQRSILKGGTRTAGEGAGRPFEASHIRATLLQAGHPKEQIHSEPPKDFIYPLSYFQQPRISFPAVKISLIPRAWIRKSVRFTALPV